MKVKLWNGNEMMTSEAMGPADGATATQPQYGETEQENTVSTIKTGKNGLSR